MQDLQGLINAHCLFLVISKWNQIIPYEEQRDVLIVEGILDMLVGEDEVAVLRLIGDVQFLGQHLQTLRGVLVFVDVLSNFRTTSAALATS